MSNHSYKLLWPGLLTGILMLMTAGSLPAQSAPGKVHGLVADASGAVIPGTAISVKGKSGRAETTSADARGTFQISGLAPGQYTMSASFKGFGIVTKDFELTSGQDLNLDLVLKPAVQQLEILVQGKEGEEEGQGRGVGVSADSNANATVISGKELDYLSDDPSDLANDLLELAGPAAGPSGGQIYVDGFSSGTLPSKVSIREVRINQNPFAAEQDKLGYGRVDVYTKPGSRQFHGQIGVDDNDAIFNSADPFIPDKLAHNTAIVTGDFLVPLTNKLTGYLSFQRRNINNTIGVNSIILDSNLNQVPFRQSLPLSDRVDMGIGRLDYVIDPNRTLIARYSYTGATDKNTGLEQFDLPSQVFDTRSYEHRVQISYNSRISARTENDVRFEFKRSYNAQIAQGTEPEVEVAGAFASGHNPIGRALLWQDYYEVQNHTLMINGKHGIKFGGRMRLSLDTGNSTQFFNGQYSFSSIDAYRITLQGMQQGLTPAQIRAAGGGAEQFDFIRGEPGITLNAVDIGLYAQDEWRIRPNLNLGYGLRYETQNLISDHLDFAPRVGIAWGLGGDGKGGPNTVIRAGFGLFYDRYIAELAAITRRIDGVHAQEIVFPAPDFYPNLPAPNQAGGIPTRFRAEQGLRSPYTMQTGVSVERQIRKSATVSVTYLFSRGLRQLISRNINSPEPGTFNPDDPASGVRPLGPGLNVFQFESAGNYRQNQLVTNVNLRTSSRISLVGRHTLSYAYSNVASSGALPAAQFDPRTDYGRAAFDVRHRISAGAVIDLPGGFRASPLFLLKSGNPFDIVMAEDLNGDSVLNDRPAFATDLSRPSVVFTRYGAFDSAPIAGQTIIPRNVGTSPLQYTVNLRLARTFVFGEKQNSGNPDAPKSRSATGRWDPHYSLSLSVTAQNLLNHTNAGPSVGILTSPLFGQSTALSGGAYSSTSANRRISLQAAIKF